MTDPVDDLRSATDGLDELERMTAKVLPLIREKFAAGDWISAQAFYEDLRDAVDELEDAFAMLAAHHRNRLRGS